MHAGTGSNPIGTLNSSSAASIENGWVNERSGVSQQRRSLLSQMRMTIYSYECVRLQVLCVSALLVCCIVGRGAGGLPRGLTFGAASMSKRQKQTLAASR